MSRVKADVRLLAGIFMLAVLSRTAEADRVTPVRPVQLGLFFSGHGGAVNNVNAGGMGPLLELAVGSGRTQYFIEGGVNWIQAGPQIDRESGVQVRSAAGMRWIARSFEMDRTAAIEMTIEGFVGGHKIWMPDAELLRPELGFGWGLQIRRFRNPHFGVRFGLRVFFAPTDEDETITPRCTSACETSSSMTNGGIMVTIGGTR